jgi:hypothetical protein
MQGLGIRLERRRIDASLTQAELATKPAFPRTLARIEAGHSIRVVRIASCPP